MEDKKPSFTNRLANEKSPYLLQHAHNPVDWYPWGEEAFRAARDQDKPIFLSIGYSTCHWCHVMEKESFEDPSLAQLMNQTFISIKVDREELPEVDALYMEFAQSMMSGAAGWPLNVIITPELQPFFATTYLPSHNKHGLMGLQELIVRIQEIWKGEEREKILAQAERIVEAFAGAIHVKGEEMPLPDQIDDAIDLLYKTSDPVYGGMNGAPKFPIGYQLSFMLRYSSKAQDSRALFLVERTLDMMHRGGIYDHLGGGFSRYSVDERWMIPHFEKMLYDNALLAQTYLEAWQMTKRPLYRQVCENIIHYVLRDMTHSGGGFYSAEDADTEGEEGYFYTWPYNEVEQILGEEGHLFCEYYDITPQGNFTDRSVLNTKDTLEDFAAKHGISPHGLNEQFQEQAQRLWAVREKRIHPLKDDKILSSWNGLMIYSLVKAGCAFNNQTYIDAAIKAARFIQRHMWVEGKLYRRWRDGEVMFPAGLDEYAFLIRGALSLFEADCGSEWLQWAIEMTRILKDQFKEPDGAFYQTDGKDENIILRKCQFSDGAEPSGNAVHCENLLKLYQITGEDQYLNDAEDVMKAVKKYLDTYLLGYGYHLMNLLQYYHKKNPTVVVALNEKNQYEAEIRQLLYQSYIPHQVVVWSHVDEKKLENLIPGIATQKPLKGKTTLYICYQGVCQQPITEFTEIIQAIHDL